MTSSDFALKEMYAWEARYIICNHFDKIKDIQSFLVDLIKSEQLDNCKLAFLIANNRINGI